MGERNLGKQLCACRLEASSIKLAATGLQGKSMANDFDWARAKTALGHVLWIGGGSEAGKSTISKRLAEEFDFEHYHGDETYWRHVELP